MSNSFTKRVFLVVCLLAGYWLWQQPGASGDEATEDSLQQLLLGSDNGNLLIPAGRYVLTWKLTCRSGDQFRCAPPGRSLW